VLDRTAIDPELIDDVAFAQSYVNGETPCAGWGWNDPDKLNVNGSGISLGHPIGATGARMLATGLRELRRRQGRYLLETMCVGGGQGLAALFQTA
jgi:acetyl-CoA C-acetyltransferase